MILFSKKKGQRPVSSKVSAAAKMSVEAMESRLLLDGLATWTFENTAPASAGPFVPEAGINAAASESRGFHAGTSTYSSPVGNGSAKSFSSNTWAVNDYYQFKTSTTGESHVQLTFDQISSSTGPKNFQVQYSTDGTTFTPFGAAYNVLVNATPTAWSASTPITASTYSFDLTSIPAVNNQPTVYFRLVDTSTTSAGGATVAAGGTDRVDNVSISGFTGPGTPSIGSFTVNPTSVGSGPNTVTLTASNVAETGGFGSVAGVKFYLDSDGDGTLTAADALVGAGTKSGTNYTLSNVSTGAFAPGTYTYFAVATDGNTPAVSSPASSATLTVTAAATFNFSAATYAANEADGTATITVTLGSPATAATSVQYATSDGTDFADAGNPNVDGAALAGRDYSPASGTLNFAVGDTTKTFTVPLTNVKTLATSRTVNLTLSNPGAGSALGTTSTAGLVITDNPVTAPNGVATVTSTPSYSAQLTNTTVTGVNGFLALAHSNVPQTTPGGFGSGANVGPELPFLEFSTGSAIYPTAFASSTVDSVQLSLYNTATSGTFGGIGGSFDVYVLTTDADALATPTTRFFVPGSPPDLSIGNTGPTTIGTLGSTAATSGSSSTPLLVGTANFTNNIAGYNDFVFDNLSAGVKSFLTSSLNSGGSTAIRFVITPSAGSPVAADWEGNSTFANSSEKPVLSLLVEKSAAKVESFTLTTPSVTVNKGDTATLTVTRSGTDLSDTATVPYTINNGTAVAGTDFTGSNGSLSFGPNITTKTITIAITANTPISGDKSFTVSLSTPTVNGVGHTAATAAPATETVTIHDTRTTVVSQQTASVATVQPAGPRQGGNGTSFFNVEGSGAAANASFGVADFNTTGNTFTLPAGQTVGTINSISLGTVNAPASFSHNGPVDVYLVDDSTSSIDNSPNASTLFFNSAADPTEGLGTQLGKKYLLGTFNFSVSQSSGTFTDVALSNADATALGLLANDLNTGAVFRIVLTPEDTAVAATYAGITNGIIDGVPSTPEAPRLTFNYTPAVATPLPSWLSANSIATYNTTTHVLTVTGATTIIADPGIEQPIINATGAAAIVTFQATGTVASGQAFHLGGLTLASGAKADVKALPATGTNKRTHNNHVLIILGQAAGNTAPPFTVDSASGSKFDLEDNDLIVHHGNVASVRGLANTGRNVPVGGAGDGTWDGLGLTSSAAAAADTAVEKNVLAVTLNSQLDNTVGSFNDWVVGSVDETLSPSDVIVKYTYNGDFAFEGMVGDNSYSVFSTYFNRAPGTQTWTTGDTNGDGNVNDDDYSVFSTQFNRGTGGNKGELL